MTTLINVHEAKTHLSRILDRAVAGEDIVIARAGHPLVRLMPVAQPPPRKPGFAKGRVTDAFFEPLPDEELQAFDG